MPRGFGVRDAVLEELAAEVLGVHYRSTAAVPFSYILVVAAGAGPTKLPAACGHALPPARDGRVYTRLLN